MKFNKKTEVDKMLSLSEMHFDMMFMVIKSDLGYLTHPNVHSGESSASIIKKIGDLCIIILNAQAKYKFDGSSDIIVGGDYHIEIHKTDFNMIKNEVTSMKELLRYLKLNKLLDKK